MNNDKEGTALDTVLQQILLNQREILLGLSILITPKCRGRLMDALGETACNNALINRYHETEQILGLKWAQEVPFQGKYGDE